MSVSPEEKAKKRFSIWAAMTFGIILSCVTGFIIGFTSRLGAFTFWRSLSGPPSGAIRIIDADGYNVWVEATNGNIYAFSSHCYENETCNQWVLLNDVLDISSDQYSQDREKDCHAFWGYPLLNNPIFGKVTECVNASVFHPEVKIDTFFALMSDGTVRYSVHGGLYFISYLFVSTIFLLVLVGILLFRLYQGNFVLRRQNAG